MMLPVTELTQNRVYDAETWLSGNPENVATFEDDVYMELQKNKADLVWQWHWIYFADV